MSSLFRALTIAVAAAGCSASCGASSATSNANATADPGAQPAPAHEEHASGSPAAPPLAAGQAEAIFAGGCFWCMEAAFDDLDGVISATSGYTGGEQQHPTYDEVSSGGTGHAESVRVVYDPTRITYEQLLDVFWHNIDPTQSNGQFCDHGTQYRSAVFYLNDEQRQAAERHRAEAADQLDAEIVTQIVPAGTFWVAEDYHQDFHRTNPVRYRSYRTGCGRDARLEQLWGASGH